jgi:1,4-dihydroxy-6-naphthoate synthase
MDRGALNFGFSPCPNDTFAFHALVHGLVSGPAVVPHIDDVEALNERAESGVAEVTKVSIAAYGRIRDRYALLRAGGAAGFGVGPIIVARSPRVVGGRIAIPGERTTAALLLRLLGAFETVPMRFDRIEDAVLRGDVDCGVVVHEGRFTYQSKGLVRLADLGAVWESRMRCPIPLAAIAIRRDLAPQWASRIDAALRASVQYAFDHPDASAAFIAQHAQEMDADVVRRHIQLYVNDYTLDLDEGAVQALLAFGDTQGVFPAPERSTPLFEHARGSRSGVLS